MLNFEKQRIVLAEYWFLGLILLTISFILFYLLKGSFFSIEKIVLFFLIIFIGFAFHNYGGIVEIIIENDTISICKWLNKKFTYKLDDMTMKEKKRWTYTIQKYYVLSLIHKNGKTYKFDSTYWQNYIDIKETLIEYGVRCE